MVYRVPCRVREEVVVVLFWRVCSSSPSDLSKLYRRQTGDRRSASAWPGLRRTSAWVQGRRLLLLLLLQPQLLLCRLRQHEP